MKTEVATLTAAKKDVGIGDKIRGILLTSFWLTVQEWEETPLVL